MFLGNRFNRLASAAMIALIVFTAASCTTVEQQNTAGSSKTATGSSEPMYYGYGSGENSIEAIQLAKKNAAEKAAVDLLGPAAAEGQGAELSDFFASINDIEPYIIAGSQETVESRSGDGFYFHLGIRVNLDVLASKLKASDILGGQIDGREGNDYRLIDQPSPVKTSDAAVVERPAELELRTSEKDDRAAVETDDAMPEATAEELKIIRDYLSSLTYMVYFNEETAVDSFLTRTAVISANRYLDGVNAEYVDLAQIERIKADQQLVYEEETGEAVSIIQWIAHKLNADIYIELSLNTSSRTENGKYYGSANVTLNSYNASTAEGLGSAVYQTIPPAFSKISEDDALANAVSAAVFNGMKTTVAEVENQSAKAASKGFKYNLTIINTPDSRQLRDFSKRMERDVRSIKRVSYAAEESTFEVYLIGDIADLEDLVYDAAETIAGLEGILLIMQRGNSITFDTGM